MHQRIFAFDFDGVIGIPPEEFQGHDFENVPNEEVIVAIRLLKQEGHLIILHSTRGEDFLRTYCAKYDIPVDYYNHNPHFENKNAGKPVATVYIDDRAFCYRGQRAEELVNALKAFEPFHKRKKKDNVERLETGKRIIEKV